MRVLVVYCDDLLAVSQIQSSVGHLGWKVKTAAWPEICSDVIDSTDIVLLDLAKLRHENLDVLAAWVRSWREQRAGVCIWAFGPHVQEGLLAAARDAGCDLVLPRGRFLRELQERLSRVDSADQTRL